MIEKPSIAVLLTCHNRKVKTLQCLTALFAQKDTETAYRIEVFLVDDASTDGTGAAIKIQFPTVQVIEGNGDLFWNRGMHLAWQTAAAANDFDYYLWLNDDTFLNQGALGSLLQEQFSEAIVCGTTQSQQNLSATYGGYSSKPRQLIRPNGNYQKSDYCNGNCVLIPKAVFHQLGNLDPIFHHAVGDFDYSLRASKMGIAIYVAPEYVGTCESHDSVPKWRDQSVPIFKRLQLLYAATSGCHPKEFFVFDKRHHGLMIACFHYFTIHLRATMPSLWRFR